jgi:Carboxypeptidase regulatory-like domain
MNLSTRSRLARLSLAALMCTLAWAAPALAQTDGRFTGTVLDPSGAAVPNATVVVKNEKTGDEKTVVSNGQGRYTVR